MVSAFLLYFLLALDDLFLRKLASVLPHMRQRRKAVVIARSTQHDLSRYVLVRTATNVGLGTLNPVMIFTWLIFWGWIWGIPGALIAIPLLAMAKIAADNVESLAPLGAFLGR